MSTRITYIAAVCRGMILIFLMVLLPFHVGAQRASAHVTVMPTEIKIGEQALINLKVITPKDKQIYFPVYEQEIVPGIEVITMLPTDTTIENNVMTLEFKYVITSFDSTLYHIPYIPIFDGTDTIFSNSFGLKVTSPELSDSTVAYLDKIHRGETDSIDFELLRLYDIKAVKKPPFVWTDYLWVLWIVLGIALLIALIGVIIYLLLKKKKKGYIFKPPVVLPPHTRALAELEKLREEKIWQKGRVKEFYTRLTHILRVYIFEREDINAMEMTSGEILNEIRKVAEVDSAYENLKQVLSTADLVKFAKYQPLPDENDLSMVNALFYVNQTREPDPIPSMEELEKMDNNDASEQDAERR